MNLYNRIECEIEVLTNEIQSDPFSSDLLMERGRLYYKKGLFDKALNDFTHVLNLPTDIQENKAQASQYVTLIKEIFEFRNMDIYNP